MASDGKVVFQIEGDARGVKNTIKDVTCDIEKESKKWDDAVKESTDKGEGFFKGMLKGIVGAISAAGIAKLILDWGKAAVSAASDLAEVQNVVDVTFGDSARQIQTWAEQAGKQYGLTETQAKRYASTIGAMLKSQGTAQKDVLEMSESLAGLAADMASFYNLDFDTAFEKIRAGISGETMPLKQLGINMSVANLEAFALEQGITKSYAAMSQGEQTLLRYQYLMKATADAQGDFARTSDGYANATRRLSTSFESFKAKAGSFLMQYIGPITNGIADMFDSFTNTGERTILDDFDDIDAKFGSKLDRLYATYGKASDLVKVMSDLESKTISLGNGQFKGLVNIFEEIANIERNGGNGRDYIKSIGLDVESTYRQYQVWNESIKQLTSSVPSLTEVINEETGAIDGGTYAIQSNLEAWKAAEEQKLAWTAYYSKQRALEEKKGELYGYELDAGASKKAAERYYNELIKQYPEFSNWVSRYSNGEIDWEWTKQQAASALGIGAFPSKEEIQRFGKFEAVFDKYHEAVKTAESSESEYVKQREAFAEADQQLADAKAYLVELYGKEVPAIDAVTGATIEYTEEAKTAQEELKNYMTTVAASTAQAVDSIVKGFSVIERPTQDLFEKRSKLIEQQNELNRSTKDGEKRYQELQAQIDELNKSMDQYSAKGMQDGLESQLAFMDEYLKNLEKAQQMGLSDELLASLSDGSVQSAEYLSSLVANPEQAAAVDELYKQVQEKKKGFTDALTAQKLSADETYDAIAAKAKETIDGLALGDEAQSAMEQTTDGIANGLDNGVDKIAAAVDRILAELNRIPNIQFNSAVGAIVGNINSHLLDGSHETGLDYVPFDGYLASLHEGESILTAEENRIWQRFKNGASPQSMDYDALGATMRENVQAGGNVYLDGKTVGRVISDQQGNAYRQLQRSGWQQ
jgi:hypothetical protein